MIVKPLLNWHTLTNLFLVRIVYAIALVLCTLSAAYSQCAAPTCPNATIGSTGTATFSATPGANANLVRWYTTSSGGTPLATGLSYTTLPIGPATYYISSYSTTTGCESALPRVAVQSIENVYPIVWTDLQNSILNSNNTITKTTGTEASAVSTNAIQASAYGWMQFTVTSTGNAIAIGLSRPNSLIAQSSIDYAFNIDGSGQVTIKELGVVKMSLGLVAAGDIFRILRLGANINYYRNGGLLFTNASTPSYVLIVDAFIASGSLPSVTTSFQRTPQTFYAIANGNWNDTNTWSFTRGGPPAQLYPAKGDVTNIKGYSVLVNSGIYCSNVNVVVNTAASNLRVDGAGSSLNVYGKVYLTAEAGVAADGIIVRNNGKVNVITP